MRLRAAGVSALSWALRLQLRQYARSTVSAIRIVGVEFTLDDAKRVRAAYSPLQHR
jgi:hypothetical protein